LILVVDAFVGRP